MIRYRPLRFPSSAVTRAVGALLTTVAMTAAVLLTAAGPAQAEPWPVTDSFENNPRNRWSFWLTGDAEGYLISSSPRTGGIMAILRPDRDWASIQRTVTLDPSGGARTCGASVYVGKRGLASTISLEVIDAATWTYISNTTAVAPSLPYGSYEVVNFANFAHRTSAMVFRIGMEDETGDLDIDDFFLWCSRPLS